VPRDRDGVIARHDPGIFVTENAILIGGAERHEGTGRVARWMREGRVVLRHEVRRQIGIGRRDTSSS
jgi:hypothetical protein